MRSLCAKAQSKSAALIVGRGDDNPSVNRLFLLLSLALYHFSAAATEACFDRKAGRDRRQDDFIDPLPSCSRL